MSHREEELTNIVLKTLTPHTHKHTGQLYTVTLAAHARRGLIISSRLQRLSASIRISPLPESSRHQLRKDVRRCFELQLLSQSAIVTARPCLFQLMITNLLPRLISSAPFLFCAYHLHCRRGAELAGRNTVLVCTPLPSRVVKGGI